MPYQVGLELINTAAANLGQGVANPPYSRADFLAFYPQFTDLVPNEVLDQYITLANSIVLFDRWGDNWKLGMGLVVAHYSTLYLQATPAEGASASQVANAGRPAGLATSESVDGLSISYDYSLTGGGMEGWDVWKSTVFGTQFAGLAKMIGVTVSYVW